MKNTLVVVHSPSNWPLHIPEVEVVAARAYLTEKPFSEMRRVRVFNLCRSYRYQSLGYYVSLLAQARGQKPIPSVTTIQDLKTPAVFRTISGDLEDLIQQSLAPIRSDSFTLSIYFGRNVAKRYERLSSAFFRLFEAPLLRADFRKSEEWELRDISLLGVSDVPEDHRPFVVEAARLYLAGRPLRSPKRPASRYDLAILSSDGHPNPASNARAIKKFEAAGEELGLSVEIIDRADYGRLAEFDALFIRDTTSVNHYTYRFSRRASAEGLVVVDDPESIVKCANKVYLAELLERHGIATPRTLVVSRSNPAPVVDYLGLPCILKQPDSAFSQGVFKAETPEQLEIGLARLLGRSELVIAQEFLPTPFDWRVGILDRQVVYACRYHMVRKHWQIAKQVGGGREYGRVEAVPLGEVPTMVLKTALRAANLIGGGLYGVDLKEVGNRCPVIEVNDNPSIDAGYEDTLLKDELYRGIMAYFRRRLDFVKGAAY